MNSKYIPEKVLRLIDDLESNFWSIWVNHTDKFPDTEDASRFKILALESAISCIVGDYLYAYPPSHRRFYLENLMGKLWHVEYLLRTEEGEM